MKRILLLFAVTLGLMNFSFASNLKIKTFNPGKEGFFNITSTIIYGDKDAILIDAQFEKKHAEKLVQEIKALNRNLVTVYISHSDPDFYFGLDVIKKNFPNAKIISTAQTAYLISASMDDKLTVWKDQIPGQAPSELIVPESVSSIPDLEGNKIEIVENKDDNAHTFLWIPSLKTIVGGISVTTDSHLWLSDTKGAKALDNWIKQIDMMKELNPKVVIPSHYMKEEFSPKSLDFVKGYLTNFKTVVETNQDSKAIIDYMLKAYPSLDGEETLVFGTKVYLGETEWDLKTAYPPLGHKLIVDYGGDFKFEITFENNKKLTFVGLKGANKGLTETVEYTVVEVAYNLFMVYWEEPVIGAKVVQIQDYNKNIVYANIVDKSGKFINLKGTLKLEPMSSVL